MNENDFTKDNFFVSQYVSEHEDIEGLKKQQKEAIKEIYAFAWESHKSGRKYSETDIVNMCSMYLMNKDQVSKIFKNVAKNKETFGLNDKSPIEKTIIQIKSKWDIRRNVVNNCIEYSEKGMNDFESCNIANVKVHLEKIGNKYSMEGLRTLFNSDEIEAVDFFNKFFEDLPKWDGIDHIKHVCSFVKTNDMNYFVTMLKKMMARCIKCSIDPNYANRYIFILSGENQSTGKTSFVEMLNPMGSNYYKISSSPKGKDSLIALGENFIINYDEIDHMGRHDLGILKQQISLRHIKERRVFGSQDEYIMRRANFFGTTNHYDILTDTQNSRFIIVKTDDFEWQKYKDYDIDLLWAQAFHLLNDPDFNIELTSDEKGMQEELNDGFKDISIEEQIVLGHVSHSDNFLPCISIFESLQARSLSNLNKNSLFKTMSSMNFKPETKRVNGKKMRGYYCKVRDFIKYESD